MKMKKALKAILLLWWSVASYVAQAQQQKPDFLNYTKSPWVDSVYNAMTPDERIAQLIFVPSFKTDQMPMVEELIDKYKVGGVVFFRANAVDHALMINRYTPMSKVPLAYALDAEWGVGMRVLDGISFPYAMTLGAIQDEALVYDMGRAIARHFHRLGMHINFAPVADVNNNPKNPVISYRSFGENPENVYRKASAYVRGLQDEKILAVIKHFPGHGDTDVDSHHDLPIIKHDIARLDSVELYPFKKLVADGAGGVMTAHLSIPALDNTPNEASSLSDKIIKGILREKLGFEGLTFTDGIHMQGIIKHNSIGEAHAKALAAGNDVVEFSTNVKEALDAIRKAIKDGTITEKDIEEKCRKLLAFKYWAGISKDSVVKTENLTEDLNNSQDLWLNDRLAQAAVTVLKNDQNLMPLKALDQKKMAVLSIGSTDNTPFQLMAANYTKVDFFNIDAACKAEDIKKLKEALKEYDLVLAGVHNLFKSPSRKSIVVNLNDGKEEKLKTRAFGISDGMVELIKYLSQEKNAIISVFANAYAVDVLEGVEDAKGLLLTYQDGRNMEEAAVQVIFGGCDATGKLPVSINQTFPVGSGIDILGGNRLGYTEPEAVGISADALNTMIDSLVQEGLDVQAYPGCQVLVARKGKVILNKAYGFHTYYKNEPVTSKDVYDLASVTKVAAATTSIMKMQGDGVWKMDMPFSTYWKDFKGTDKEVLTFREILAHQAGLKPYLSFWTETLDENKEFKKNTFDVRPSKKYPVQVAPHLFLHKKFKDKYLYKMVAASELGEKGTYRYSGLSFLLYPEMIEQQTGKTFDTFLDDSFYAPLGANRLTFNPSRKFSSKEIIPTENDNIFRFSTMQGYVHDEAAAMLGGVSGNAGLFGNAQDLAKLLQMFLQEGNYGGESYLPAETVKEFTSVQFPQNDNRRGLGFDKPSLDNEEKSEADAYPCKSASMDSYGHTGFTGTMFWVDPKEELVFVFLSNRVYPTRENSELYKRNIRSRMLQGIYDLIDQKVASIK
ncbi:glycoside hydrolase family 3 N-terminal domain-containing protein [Limibacter armeniacum]|uniref:glycoside hydrolase family 3 N-terminal domain-containing protein n=1 Tax=Limibacter armeniacum TaxID=466084 RepID=UPI002FE687F5